jgi:hypothetical protein
VICASLAMIRYVLVSWNKGWLWLAAGDVRNFTMYHKSLNCCMDIRTVEHNI